MLVFKRGGGLVGGDLLSKSRSSSCSWSIEPSLKMSLCYDICDFLIGEGNLNLCVLAPVVDTN